MKVGGHLARVKVIQKGVYNFKCSILFIKKGKKTKIVLKKKP